MSEQTSQTVDETTEQATSSPEETPLSQKDLAERMRQTKNYFKLQIESLKPQVELAELRCRMSKATYDNYRYSLELHNIEKQQDVAEKPVEKTDENVATKEAPVIQMNAKDTETTNE